MRNALSALLLGAGLLLPNSALGEPPAKTQETIDPAAKRITGSEAYIPTFGLRASISRGYAVSGVMSVDAGIEVPSPKTRKKAQELRPRLMSDMRDAVLNYATLAYIPGETPNLDLLSARMQRAVDGVLGPGEARVALASVIVFSR